MNTFSFNNCSKDDIEIIFIECKNMIDKYENISEIPYEKVLSWCKEKITKNIYNYTRILYNDKTIGYYYLIDHGEEFELDDFYILPQYQNKGIGTYILNKITSETTRPIFLYVFSQNNIAINLYKKSGFRKIKSVSDTRFIMEFNNAIVNPK